MKWKNIYIFHQAVDLIHISSFYPKTIKRTWYICKVMPNYKALSQQLNIAKNIDSFAHQRGVNFSIKYISLISNLHDCYRTRHSNIICQVTE